MTLPAFVSLNAVSVAGPGSSNDLGQAVKDHTVTVWTTGSPTWGASIEGSLDNSNWVTLPIAGSTLASNSVSVVTVSTHYVRYVRVNLVSISGGTSPTLTATIQSVPPTLSGFSGTFS